MTAAKKPRRLTERQIAKILAEYGFEARVTRMLESLREKGYAWRTADYPSRPVCPWEASPEEHEAHRKAYPYRPPARDWVVATELGMLGVTVREDWIACVFEEPERAAKCVDASVPSGKWNHHAFVTHCHKPESREEIERKLGETLRRFRAGLEDITGIIPLGD